MKLSILQENLHRSLQDIIKFVPSKPQLPILSSILFEIGEGQVVMFATDLHAGVKMATGGKIEGEGKIAIPAKVFAEYIASLSAGMLEIEKKGEGIVVSGQRSRATFQTVLADEYPPFPKQEGVKTKIDRKELVEMVEKGGMSAGNDESRPVLASVLFEGKDGELSVVSTDGYRLSKKTSRVKGWGDGRILVPSKSLKEVIRIIAKMNDKTAEIVVSEELRQVSIAVGDSVFLLRMVEGNFPEYGSIIPAEFKNEIVFDPEEALSSLRRAMIFSREAASIVKMKLLKDEVVFQSSSSSVGEQTGSISSKMKKGGEEEIAFNGRYVQEFLSLISGESVVFCMNESLKPGMFIVENDPTFLYIIMPFRLQDGEKAA